MQNRTSPTLKPSLAKDQPSKGSNTVESWKTTTRQKGSANNKTENVFNNIRFNTDETNMFAKKTQTPMKIANMEFHPTLILKLFTDEIHNFQRAAYFTGG